MIGEAQPLISVIIPIYNCAPYLGKCLDSILNQTYLHLEVLLIDDGSTDGGETVCRKYEAADARVHYWKKENGGVSSARNLGLEKASGDYVAFVDGDDYIESHMYAALLKALVDTGADIAACRHIMEEQGSEPVLENPKPGHGTVQVYTGDELLLELLRGRETTVSCTKLIRRSLAHAFPPLAVGEDSVFMAELFLQPCKLAQLQYPYYHYVQRGGSARLTPFSPKHLDAVASADLIWEKTALVHPEFLPQFQGFLFDVCIGNLARIYVWDVEDTYPDAIRELERRIREVWPSMDRKSVRPAKRLAWSLYRVSKGLFRRVMKWYYRRTLYRGLDL